MNIFKVSAVVAVIVALFGCMSVPKFASDNVNSAEELLRELGFSSRGYRAVPPSIMANNTLALTIKIFITDSNAYKVYFSNSRVFSQELGMTAYGVLPLPTSDDPSTGYVRTYTYKDGIYYIDSRCGAHKPYLFVVSRRSSDGDMMCFDSGCGSSLPVGWNSFNCKMERGNTLKLKG